MFGTAPLSRGRTLQEFQRIGVQRLAFGIFCCLQGIYMMRDVNVELVGALVHFAGS